ncbi:MAG: MMPL family transporter [Clostridiales bacterium]|nr:MMPL family transporter [Clostridiales bacterium]
MDKLAGGIVKYKNAILVLFIALTLVCAALYLFVGINYNMVDYLPPSAQSTRAVNLMKAEFSQSIPNLNVMVRDVSVVEALAYKALLAEVPGVSDVMWLDDVADLKTPLRMQNAALVEEYYKDGAALFMATIGDGMSRTACAEIRALIGEKGALSGEAADMEFMQNAAVSEVLKAMAILVPLAVVILMIFTGSWLEPLLYLCAIGVAVVVNMGTNIIFGRVSFLTNSVSPILQLAVTMDYAIFLLHAYAENRKVYDNKDEAMKRAIISSVTAISASALTTLFGFLALVFMQFKIGADLGLVLFKGIICGFISVIFFMPSLTLRATGALDRTRRRSILPDFSNIHRVLSKASVPAILIVVLVIVPSFLGQRRTEFVYGAGSASGGTYLERDKKAVEDVFGKTNIIVLLVPSGDIVRERDLGLELESLEYVNAVMSYALTVGPSIPAGFLSHDITGQFYSEEYARIIIYTDTPGEGDLAFGLVERINKAAARYYDEFYSAGQSANLFDMKNIVKVDTLRVNIIAIVSILLVLMLSFRSLTLPFILLITIETGIWINLSIPYFTDVSINFIGFLVLSTVQLGATVDYAILLTDYYRENRKLMPKKAALHKSLGDAFKSIIISGLTLSMAGFALYLTSTNMSIRDIGLLLGRGTLLSMFMVLCFLPTMLNVCDKAIAKTTLKSGFYFDE